MRGSPLLVFLDRSVGTKKIALALRELGLDVETIHDRYGDESPRIPDTRWIEDATVSGRILIGADKRIRYRSLERIAICRHGAKCFTFPRGDLTAGEMIRRIIQHLAEIGRLAKEPGPYVVHLRAEQIVPMQLDCDDLGGESWAPE
ncbi:hypothetical protein ACNTMW_11425 [Planosporangium sp. 12N6]|uniref:PIN-like domain-containing protein n=1 Tax=Planosporangium spinosum TaxID=3402278 RepID=UPI003CEAA8AF